MVGMDYSLKFDSREPTSEGLALTLPYSRAINVQCSKNLFGLIVRRCGFLGRLSRFGSAIGFLVLRSRPTPVNLHITDVDL